MEAIVEKIKEKVDELNELFERAAVYYIKFDGCFDQARSFGAGKVGHLSLKTYKEI